jgi:hypothetical protein
MLKSAFSMPTLAPKVLDALATFTHRRPATSTAGRSTQSAGFSNGTLGPKAGCSGVDAYNAK